MRLIGYFWAVLALAATALVTPAPAASASASLSLSAQRSTPNPVRATSRATPPVPSGTTPTLPSPAKGIKAVVVKSWNGCSSAGLVWDDLNANWSSYGTVPISIDYANHELCSSAFTLAALEASHASVVIINDPAGYGLQFTADEVTALKTYAEQGHDLIGSFLTFGWGHGRKRIDNSALAPLFGLAQDDGWSDGHNDLRQQYRLRSHKLLAKRLIRGLPNPYVSHGYRDSQLPADGVWNSNELAGATIVGLGKNRRSAITVYRATTYRAIYVASMAAYKGGAEDEQFLYNAIIYPKIG